MAKEDITIVLAHGAWADGSSWMRVIERLNAAGHRAMAVPLPLTTLADDVAALGRVIARAGGPVVLVGHAYAGAVIGATQAGIVKALVYINALAPDAGETVADVFNRTPRHPLAPPLVPDADELIWLPEEAFAQAFAPQASRRDQVVLAAVQRPISLSCITETVSRPLWRGRPSWYLVADEDRMISADNQRFMAERMGATIATGSLDHAPMIAAPGAVTQVILAAIQA